MSTLTAVRPRRNHHHQQQQQQQASGRTKKERINRLPTDWRLDPDCYS